VVYGVSRIALPSSDWGDSLRDDVKTKGIKTKGVEIEFVAGPENRLAVPALQRLLTDNNLSAAAEFFNPLVLLGSTGTGKSHLARGITRHWRTLFRESEVQYLTFVDFARLVRAAREDGQLDKFRDQLANLRLLVLEDLHRLQLSPFVQHYLRDTLDLLVEADTVVVITAQQPPAAMAALEAGLRDRLSSGLTVRLQTPGIEARQELLRQSALQRGIQLKNEQLQQMSHKIEGTASQLFRALAEYELTDSFSAGRAPAVFSADRTSAVLSVDSAHLPLKIKQIIAVVARYFSLTQAALCSSARRKSLVYARSVTVYLARSLTDQSYTQIGQALGRRDHTTIMHASRTLKKRLTNDASTQHDIEELKRILTAT